MKEISVHTIAPYFSVYFSTDVLLQFNNFDVAY